MKLMRFKASVQFFCVFEVSFDESEGRASFRRCFFQFFQPCAFQSRIIIRVEIVESDDWSTPFQQRVRNMVSYEPSTASDQVGSAIGD